MKRYQNLVMVLAAIALVALPLWMVKKSAPGTDGKQVQIFAGADDTAKDLVSTLSPSYKPWVQPLLDPPSAETGSLLFALQAALGAGFIGYWYGCSSTRAKLNQSREKTVGC